MGQLHLLNTFLSNKFVINFGADKEPHILVSNETLYYLCPHFKNNYMFMIFKSKNFIFKLSLNIRKFL